jgi:hypothetical protein
MPAFIWKNLIDKFHVSLAHIIGNAAFYWNPIASFSAAAVALTAWGLTRSLSSIFF